MSTINKEWLEKAELKQVSVRSTVVGLLIGTMILFSNFQFGLQTGWVSMMSLPSALLAFASFKALQKHLGYAFSDVENVYVQSLAVAVGTGPLAFGFVGIIPAIEKFLTPDEANSDQPIRFSIPQLIIWSFGLAFFGVFFAVLLRKQIIVKEKLKFPSGSATATMIAVLHQSKTLSHDSNTSENVPEIEDDNEQLIHTSSTAQLISTTEETTQLEHLSKETYSKNILLLTVSFGLSAFYSLISYFFPVLRNLPIFGRHLAQQYLWTFQPSPAYMGQGIIMGLPTVSSMLLGAFLGWAILGPLAQHMGWATGPVDDWKTGSQGWILWISLAIMVADTVVSFVTISAISIYNLLRSSNTHVDFLNLFRSNHNNYERLESSAPGSNNDSIMVNDSSDPDVTSDHLIPTSLTLFGLLASFIICILSVKFVFESLIPITPIIVSFVLALLLSVLGVRALGETDLNPVSGIGKISQLIFALIVPKSHPGSVLINIVAGGITEAGAQQAGDLMQDLKTGHLIGASPRAQFIAQIIGSLWSVLLSAFVYRLYDHVYKIPNTLFRLPTAVVWIDCSRLVTGDGIPPHAGIFALFFGLLFGVLSFIKVVMKTSNFYAYNRAANYIPSGVAVGIGLYSTPSFTIARFLGGLGAAYWLSIKTDENSKLNAVVLSSGLVLGEGLFSIVNLLMTAAGIPHM